MSGKAVAWTLVSAIAFAAVLIFNYWASYQPLSTLVYAGIVLALCGLANVAVPFRILGVRKRRVGACLLAGGVGLAFAALVWPASTIRVAQPVTCLDQTMPEYQFFERHSARIHARPEQVMEAIRQSTFGDMKSLVTLLKIRGLVVRAPVHNAEDLQSKKILEAFSESGYLSAGNDHEITSFGVWNARENRRPDVRTLQALAEYREEGAVKMGFGFKVDDTGDGWSTVIAETRVLATDPVTRRGLGRYWRLIVPGSGLLRRQWLDGIKQRAESMSSQRS